MKNETFEISQEEIDLINAGKSLKLVGMYGTIMLKKRATIFGMDIGVDHSLKKDEFKLVEKHPVTANITPKEASKIILDKNIKRCRK